MINPEWYIRQAKTKLGNASMSDRELAETLGYSTGTISNARYGNMPDPLAIKVARLIDADPGEVLLVARAFREKDEEVKAALLSYAAKTLAALPSITASERGGMAALVDQLSAGQRTRRRAAAVVLSLGLVAGGAPSPADAAIPAGNCSALCIMLNVGGALLVSLFGVRRQECL